MRKFTKRQLQEAAEEGDSFCVKCGEQVYGASGTTQTIPCDNCGALAVLPAQAILEIVESLLEDE